MGTGLVWHELYMWHDTGSYAGIAKPGLTVEPGIHFENPATKRRFKNLLDVTGLSDRLTRIDPRPASEDELLRFHEPGYVAAVREQSAEAGGVLRVNTPFGPGSYEIGCLAAGGVIAALDAVVTGAVDNAYALVRPPGHHAIAETGMGFCLFANAALAIMHGFEAHGYGRVATVDWDVHHGNGTQAAFWRDPRVLTISIHQDRLFPQDSGAVEEIGEGPGEGFNINLPLPPGSGVGAYLSAFERIVVPALRAFAPDLIVVPSGFDAGAYDPLGRQMVHSDGYRQMTAMMMETADALCGGRLLLCHEGGYSAETVPYFGLAVIEQLSGIGTQVRDPFLPAMRGIGGQDLQPHQTAAIDRLLPHLDRLRGGR